MIPFYEEAHEKLGAELRTRVGAMDWASDDPADMVAKLGLLHVFPLLAPEKSVRALCVAREVIAYASPMADSIFAVQGLASHPLALAGVDRWRARIDDVLAGRTVGGFALTEPEAGSDVASLRSTARRDGDGWRLDGEKTFISNVGIARYFIVFANADPSLGKKGISAFLVEADAPGLDLEPIATIDDHPLGRLVMRGAHAHLVGDVGQGLRLALGTLDVFRTSVGAAANGMAQRALDEALAHVKKRVQFGKPLAEQQLVQAALADMATELHAARLLVAQAAWAKDTGRAGKTEVAMAKMFATEAAQRTVDRAVQLFGGLGVVRGGAVEKLYRSIRALRIYEGTTEIQKLIIGGALVAGGDAS
ncbi:MAG: acyl-CoA dehydrogenase family protein [Polyangiaceae bacterium]